METNTPHKEKEDSKIIETPKWESYLDANATGVNNWWMYKLDEDYEKEISANPGEFD